MMAICETISRQMMGSATVRLDVCQCPLVVEYPCVASITVQSNMQLCDLLQCVQINYRQCSILAINQCVILVQWEIWAGKLVQLDANSGSCNAWWCTPWWCRRNWCPCSCKPPWRGWSRQWWSSQKRFKRRGSNLLGNLHQSYVAGQRRKDPADPMVLQPLIMCWHVVAVDRVQSKGAHLTSDATRPYDCGVSPGTTSAEVKPWHRRETLIQFSSINAAKETIRYAL